MQTKVHEGRPEAGPERDLDLLIEKGFLLLGSIEFQIEEHLMSHGTRISPETRLFMAQMRDAAGDAATKLLDEARNRLDTASADEAPGAVGGSDADGTEPGAGELAGASLLPAMRGSFRTTAVTPRRRRRFAFGSAAAHAGLGAASAALILALLLVGPAPSIPPVQVSDGMAGVATENPRSAVTTAAAAPSAGEALGAESVDGATMRAAADPGEPEAKSADEVPKLIAAAPLRPEPDAFQPYIQAATAEAARSKATHRPPLVEALAALALRPTKAGRPPYPDPRAGPAEPAARPVGSQAAAAAEARLALTSGVRLEVQRRLALARFDPHSFDGIFGPVTRAALGEWQRASGIPATGFLDEAGLALLRDRTEEAYRSLRVAEKAAAARQQETRTVLTSPMPSVSPLNADRCRRTRTGKILYGRGVRCDFRGLKQSIARLFG